MSLVPSITETLIECKVNLVGRSRFCIHPVEEVNKIKKVGGTKDIDWQKVLDLKADLVILDKEENTLEMAQNCPVDYIALHIQSVQDVAPELEKLSNAIENNAMKLIAKRWQNLLNNRTFSYKINELPGVMEWWKKPKNAEQLIYMIWKKPWMAAGEGIFIQSVLKLLGVEEQRVKFDQKYPVIELEDYFPQQTLLLFSSEPFPFHNYKQELLELGFPCALVDGELFSWYGIRSLQFLESLSADKINKVT
ncbi:MAG: helical backbone metal receptor [Kangiellaceae bacterium]|nr:helical backbone metal receptor [Kangiellaceae bacterium]